MSGIGFNKNDVSNDKGIGYKGPSGSGGAGGDGGDDDDDIRKRKELNKKLRNTRARTEE